MSIDLEGLSAKELQALIAKANQRKKTLAKRKPVAAVRKKLGSLAKAEGYSVDELFGDSLYIIPNVYVLPETSHNANAGFQVETRRTPLGNFTLEADWFLRNIDNLIVALAESTGAIQYKNVEGAKIWAR